MGFCLSQICKAGEMTVFRNWIVFWKCGGRDKTNCVSLTQRGAPAFKLGARLAPHLCDTSSARCHVAICASTSSPVQQMWGLSPSPKQAALLECMPRLNGSGDLGCSWGAL